MADGLRLDIEPPTHGWTTVRLTAPGFALEFVASYVYDSIRDLAQGAARALAGEPDQVVAWNTEPIEYGFRLKTEAGRTRLEVYEFPDHRRSRIVQKAPLAVVEGETLGITRAIWRGLRRVQGTVPAEEFAAAWGRPFPDADVERLGESLRAHSQESTDPA